MLSLLSLFLTNDQILFTRTYRQKEESKIYLQGILHTGPSNFILWINDRIYYAPMSYINESIKLISVSSSKIRVTIGAKRFDLCVHETLDTQHQTVLKGDHRDKK